MIEWTRDEISIAASILTRSARSGSRPRRSLVRSIGFAASHKPAINGPSTEAIRGDINQAIGGRANKFENFAHSPPMASSRSSHGHPGRSVFDVSVCVWCSFVWWAKKLKYQKSSLSLARSLSARAFCMRPLLSNARGHTTSGHQRLTMARAPCRARGRHSSAPTRRRKN